jgi:hypothetical protein
MSVGASPLVKDQWWLVANLLGATTYLWLSSRTWIEPELRGEAVARSGDAVVWFGIALPVPAAFMLADIVWLIRRLRDKQSLRPMLLAGFLWTVVLGVDRLLS